MILVAALAATLVLILLFYWGQRTNLKRAHRLAVLLETLTDPEEVEYLWLGGVLGFQARYRAPQRLKGRPLRITLLLLPRHSPLYLPIAWLRNRGDRLLLTLESGVRRHPPAVPSGLASHLHSVEHDGDTLTLDLHIPWRRVEPLLQETVQWLASCS